MLIKEDVRMPVVEVAAGQVWITTVTVQIMRGVGQGKTKKVQADTLFCPGAVHSSLFPVATAICTFVLSRWSFQSRIRRLKVFKY